MHRSGPDRFLEITEIMNNDKKKLGVQPNNKFFQDTFFGLVALVLFRLMET